MSDLLMIRKRLTVFDGFNRADDATSLGSADTGQVWVATDIVFGISSNKGYAVSGTFGMATVSCDSGDINIRAKIIWKSDQADSIVFRTDGTMSNRMGFTIKPDNISLTKRISDVSTELGNSAFTPGNGVEYMLEVVCQGDSFKCYLNGIEKFSLTDNNILKSNTKHGVLLYSGLSIPTSTFDNFSAGRP